MKNTFNILAVGLLISVVGYSSVQGMNITKVISTTKVAPPTAANIQIASRTSIIAETNRVLLQIVNLCDEFDSWQLINHGTTQVKILSQKDELLIRSALVFLPYDKKSTTASLEELKVKMTNSLNQVKEAIKEEKQKLSRINSKL